MNPKFKQKILPSQQTINLKNDTENTSQFSDEQQDHESTSNSSGNSSISSNASFDDNDFQPYHFTSNEIYKIKLLKLLQDIGTPLYAYKLIMEWAKDAHMSNFNFDHQHTSHHQVINFLKKNFR